MTASAPTKKRAGRSRRWTSASPTPRPGSSRSSTFLDSFPASSPRNHPARDKSQQHHSHCQRSTSSSTSSSRALLRQPASTHREARRNCKHDPSFVTAAGMVAALLAILLGCMSCVSHSFEFKGDSSIVFGFEAGFTENEIVFTLTTTDRDGLLFYLASDPGYPDFLSINLEDGRLVVAFDLGSGVTTLRSLRTINDGFSHAIMVRRQGLEALFTIDGVLAASATAMARQDRLVDIGGLRSGGVLFFGGVPSSYKRLSTVTNEYFFAPQVTACIEGALVDRYPVTDLMPTESTNVAPTCSYSMCPAPNATTMTLSCSSSQRPVCNTGSGEVDCVCRVNAFGDECNIAVAILSAGNGGINFRLQESIAARNLEIFFDIMPVSTTSSPTLQDADLVVVNSGALVSGRGDHFAVRLIAGRIAVRYSIGGAVLSDVALAPLAVNVWSAVRVRLADRSVQVTVNDDVILDIDGSSLPSSLFSVNAAANIVVGQALEGMLSRVQVLDFYPLDLFLSGSSAVSLRNGVRIEANRDATDVSTTLVPTTASTVVPFSPNVTAIEDAARNAVVASFNRASHISIDEPLLFSDTTNNVAFLIQTLDATGTLFHVFGSRDTLLIRLEDGRIVASANVGGGAFGRASARAVNDGAVHSVEVQLTLNTLVLTVDGVETQRVGPSTFTKLNVGEGPVVGVGFSGKLADFFFNGGNLLAHAYFQPAAVSGDGLDVYLVGDMAVQPTPLSNHTTTAAPQAASPDGLALLFEPSSEFTFTYFTPLEAAVLRIVIRFKTRDSFGTLLRVFGDEFVDYVEIGLVASGFKVSFDLGGGSKASTFPAVTSDGEYHTVAVTLERGRASVEYDDVSVGAIVGVLGFRVLNPGSATKAFVGVMFKGVMSQAICQGIDFTAPLALTAGSVSLRDVLTIPESYPV